jgi:GAF domain-containing protein
VKLDRIDIALIGGAIVAGTGAVVCSQFTRGAAGQLQDGWLAGAIIAAIVTAVLPGISTWRAKRGEASATEREKDARERAFFRMNDALYPVANALAELAYADAVKKPLLRSNIQVAVMNSAAAIVGTPTATRSCFFELLDGTTLRLKATYMHSGQQPKAHKIFAADTPEGDAALAILTPDAFSLFGDVATDKPSWTVDGRAYRSLLAVPVITPDITYGLLTVDSTRAHDFDDSDIAVMRVLAGLLAAALPSP